MKKTWLDKIEIEKLKGLRNVTINFDKNLTAIMGVNGACKTTILHALACVYQPKEIAEKQIFSYFFTPNPDATWTGSKLSISYTEEDKLPFKFTRKKEYSKDVDRWKPRYQTRPKRDVFYVGISTCIPEIEKQKSTSYINYVTTEENDKISNKIIQNASEILNISYDMLLSHVIKKSKFIGVEDSNGLRYSSLSMGTGEQRIIKILQVIYNAKPDSMILIDELDLLLHINAFKKLIEKLNTIAIEHKLQIIFTTHSMIINEFTDIVDIRYIEQTSEKTLVYDFINTDVIYAMTGQQHKPIKIFVEDNLSQGIIKHIAKSMNMTSKIKICLFGSVTNAFTLASSFVLNNDDSNNNLIVIDGDCFKTEDDKLVQIKKHLTGTEKNTEEKIKKAVSYITQYNLPEKHTPEKFIYDIILESNDNQNEVVKMAKSIHSCSDPHGYINKIVERLDDDYDIAIKDIITVAATSVNWSEYIRPVQEWLATKKGL